MFSRFGPVVRTFASPPSLLDHPFCDEELATAQQVFLVGLLQGTLDNQRDPEAAAALVGARAAGNFLLARLVASALLAGHADDPAAPGWRFPASVGDAFDDYLAGLGDREPWASGLLMALAFAEGLDCRAVGCGQR